MSEKNETNLGNYKKEGKKLLPPFAQIKIEPSSWTNERLPEMLWAVLASSSLEREVALDFFRYCLSYIEGNNSLFNLTHSGIAEFPLRHRILFIEHVTSYPNINIKEILRPLLLFKRLPGYQEWQFYLGQDGDPEQDWGKIAEGLRRCMWHQSQEATDCRWLKIAAMVITEKLHCPPQMTYEILNYPLEGDQKGVRPMIRSAEIGLGLSDNAIRSEWPADFWKEAYDKTTCIPEEVAKANADEGSAKFKNELENTRKHYFDESKKIRHSLVNYFFKTSSTSGIDARHEGVFGLALYGLGVFIENNFYRTGMSINGRVMLRTLFETYITFAYLVKKRTRRTSGVG